MFGRGFLIVVFAVLLLGCSDMKISNFKDAKPQLNLFEYFDGQTIAHGIFEDRFGNLKRQFRVDITGRIEQDILTLDERFYYSDGETDQRIWTIEKNGDGQYTGKADDIIGVATGRSAGNALNWQYALDLKIGDGSLKVHFNDWMFLQEGDVLINRAKVTKWGVELGEVSIFFMKPADVS